MQKTEAASRRVCHIPANAEENKKQDRLVQVVKTGLNRVSQRYSIGDRSDTKTTKQKIPRSDE